MKSSPQDGLNSVDISRFDVASGWTSDTDAVAEESVVTLECNGTCVGTFSCLPRDVKELALGHLFVSGIISAATDIATFEFSDHKASITLTDGHSTALPPDHAPRPLSPPFPTMAPSLILKASRALENGSRLFSATGGIHSVTLWTADGTAVVTLEDVGRHNAFDKICGFCLLNPIDTRNCFLACAGRVSGSIVEKTWKLGVPVLVSSSAVTSLAVETAIQGNIRLIGFTRGTRFNVYHGKDRIG